MLNVSRSPVREALRELELNRIVVTDPVNGQRVVAAFGAADIEELYALRATLERLAHERAASRLGPKDVATLEAALAEMVAADVATPTGRADHFEADFRFTRPSQKPRRCRDCWRRYGRSGSRRARCFGNSTPRGSIPTRGRSAKPERTTARFSLRCLPATRKVPPCAPSVISSPARMSSLRPCAHMADWLRNESARTPHPPTSLWRGHGASEHSLQL